MVDVGVIGLGKLGLPFAYTLAASGFDVYGWDDDPMARVRAESDLAVLPERQLGELMWKHRVGIARPDQLAKLCQVVFVLVDTPSTADGTFSTGNVYNALRSLGDKGDAIVALVSTVSPGSCRILAAKAGRPLVYSPALIALGSVITDLQLARVWIVGNGSGGHAVPVAAILRQMSPRAEIAFMDYMSAELAKLAVNVSGTAQIEYVNDLARMAHRLGGDIDSISGVLHLAQRRIEIVAGTPVGGPCLPRDSRAYAAAGGAFGAFLDRTRHEHFAWIVAQAIAPPRPRTFHIVGRNYKDGVEYEIDSPGVALAELLLGRGLEPAPRPSAELVVIALPSRDIELRDIASSARVIDVWRAHPYLAGRCQYVPLGAPRRRAAG